MLRRRRLKRRTTSKTIYIIVVLSLVFLAGGYSLLSSQIRLTGTAHGPIQNKLDHQINYFANPWYTRIVTAHANLTRSTEVLTGGNTITTTYTAVSNTTLRNLATRFTYTNLNYYTVTGGTISNTTTCTGVTVNTQTVSATSIARNATMTVNTTIRLRTSVTRNCQVQFTVRYTYGGVQKFMYYIIKIL